MTAIAYRIYTCPRCPDTFTNPATLGGHVHAAHPQHKQRGSKTWAQLLRCPTYAGSAPRRKPTLKRASDTWPGRP